MYRNTVDVKENRKVLLFTLTLMVFGALLLYPSVSMAQEEPTDQEISQAVQNALFTDEGVSGFLIDVETNDGVVTLQGSVNNLLAKQRAEDLAETVKGVRGIVNKMEVKPPARTDEELRDAVRNALLKDPATESWEVFVSVEDGTVTLTGTVDSWQEKQLAAKVAKGVNGVEALENEITVDYKVERSDNEIESDVVGRLKWDTLVDDALISVDVDDGEVELGGTVGSLAEKTRAISDAWVAGVEAVDGGDLNVSSWARDERFRKDKYTKKSDREVVKAVNDTLLYDPRVNSFNVDVSASDGVVTLSGRVNNLKAKRSAAKDARNIVGVWRVKNQLKIRGDRPSDDAIENEVREALRNDSYVSLSDDITISAVNGEVYLKGTVDTYFEKAQADDVASRVKGVVNVTNNLDVEAEIDPLTYNPYVDEDWYLDDYDWYNYPGGYATAKDDWKIKEDIRSELYWSPFVDQNEVNVSVENGVATLTGTVDTWKERGAASENAYFSYSSALASYRSQ